MSLPDIMRNTFSFSKSSNMLWLNWNHCRWSVGRSFWTTIILYEWNFKSLFRILCRLDVAYQQDCIPRVGGFWVCNNIFSHTLYILRCANSNFSTFTLWFTHEPHPFQYRVMRWNRATHWNVEVSAKGRLTATIMDSLFCKKFSAANTRCSTDQVAMLTKLPASANTMRSSGTEPLLFECTTYFKYVRSKRATLYYRTFSSRTIGPGRLILGQLKHHRQADLGIGDSLCIFPVLFD